MTLVFLGSFDPPTNGHLHLISEALSNGASEVIMIPAWGNPWKTGQTPYECRLEMCRKLQKLYPGNLKVSDIERTISYNTPERLSSIPTWMTLEKLQKTIGEFKILTTNETYREISMWEKGEEILKENKFMIFSSDHLGETIPGSINIISLPISSSMVREKIQRKKYCPEYLPTPVLEYININKLYESFIYN